MKVGFLFRKIYRFVKITILFLFCSVTAYLMAAFILSLLKTHPVKLNCLAEKEIFVSTNGVHLDIILPLANIDSEFLQKLEIPAQTEYISFGWGDKQFYVNTPEWKDLTFKTAFTALFLKSESAMHVTVYSQKHSSWKKVKLCPSQHDKLNRYIEKSFRQNENGSFQKIDVSGYYKTDAFYAANGSFSLFRTCNIWVNKALKETGIETSVWSPFDLGVLYHLQE